MWPGGRDQSPYQGMLGTARGQREEEKSGFSEPLGHSAICPLRLPCGFPVPRAGKEHISTALSPRFAQTCG